MNPYHQAGVFELMRGSLICVMTKRANEPAVTLQFPYIQAIIKGEFQHIKSSNIVISMVLGPML